MSAVDRVAVGFTVKTQIPQREYFNGAELLSPAWTLHRAGKSAVCAVWSHQFGFELRLADRRRFAAADAGLHDTRGSRPATGRLAEGARGERLDVTIPSEHF
jgi:hypothetical protein